MDKLEKELKEQVMDKDSYTHIVMILDNIECNMCDCYKYINPFDNTLMDGKLVLSEIMYLIQEKVGKSISDILEIIIFYKKIIDKCSDFIALCNMLHMALTRWNGTYLLGI